MEYLLVPRCFCVCKTLFQCLDENIFCDANSTTSFSSLSDPRDGASFEKEEYLGPIFKDQTGSVLEISVYVVYCALDGKEIQDASDMDLATE